MKASVRAFMQKHGLRFEGAEADLDEAYLDAVKRWRRVVANFTGASKTSSAQDGGCCHCNEHHVLLVAADKSPLPDVPYWMSFTGILRRIDGLSQDFLFRTVNGAMKMVAVSNGIEWLHWVTAADDRVCPICTGYGVGGNNGYYKTFWFLPRPPPVHFGCRCIWELILYLPNNFGFD